MELPHHLLDQFVKTNNGSDNIGDDDDWRFGNESEE